MSEEKVAGESGKHRNSFLRVSSVEGAEPDMTWPNPFDPDEVAWRLGNFKEPDPADVRVAVSFMGAYSYLFSLPQKQRNKRMSQVLRAAQIVEVEQ